MKNVTGYFVSLSCVLSILGCTSEDEQLLASRDQPATLATMSTAANMTVSAQDDCATVATWISAHAETLPSSYEAVVGFPMNYRRAIFHALPAEQKSMLWQQHLSGYLASHPRLSATQIATIQRAMAMASVDLFLEPADDTKRHEALEALRRDTEAAFGQKEAQRILATLGGSEPEGSAAPAQLVTCDCSTYSDWCAWWNDCAFGGCDWSDDGCGSLWNYPCNGVCR